MICIPKLALEIQDLSLPATVLLPRLDNTCMKLILGCRLEGSTASIIALRHCLHNFMTKCLSELSQIWGNVCDDNCMILYPYAYPPQQKKLKHLIYICHRCGMQFERIYSLNHSILGLFIHAYLFSMHLNAHSHQHMML
jgi:hypothetical protein